MIQACARYVRDTLPPQGMSLRGCDANIDRCLRCPSIRGSQGTTGQVSLVPIPGVGWRSPSLLMAWGAHGRCSAAQQVIHTASSNLGQFFGAFRVSAVNA